MLNNFRPILKLALASVALGAIVPLAACNKAPPEQAANNPGLPPLPATLPLALGEERPVAYAPPATALPRARPIRAARIANPDDYYAYADDAWSYDDALGDAPPDYGFTYGDVEPWAWQGYDDSLMFVEPLDAGYRYYYYRPGDEYPYFIRDPQYGYGYDNGSLAVVYDADGRVLPYDQYLDGPWLDTASRYYDRGYRLYRASRARHPVIAANWYDVQPAYAGAFLDWEDDLWRQPNWWSYHQRTGGRRDRYWRDERARRDADATRYAAWQDQGFRTAAPPRAIPGNWQRADWARDQRRFAPAAAGFEGNDAARQHAVRREQQRTASLARPNDRQDQVQLAALRERVQRRPGIDSLRMSHMAEQRRQLEDRQVQLASRDDRASRRDRVVLQRQEQQLARAQQYALRRDRGAGTQRLAGVDRRPGAPEQRLNQSALNPAALNPMERGRQQAQPGNDRQQWQQALTGSGQQRFAQGAQAQQQQRQAQVEAQAQGQRRQEAQLRAPAETGQQRQPGVQLRAEAQQRGQAEAEARQQRDTQARQGAEQRRAAQEQARQQRAQSDAQANARNSQREQARQAAEQQRAVRAQGQAAQEQARQQRAQSDAQANARNSQREQARQAAEQQRAVRAQGQAAQEQARQQRAQSDAQANARNAQREQARQAAEQQRAAREQGQAAQEQARQQRAQFEAQANARNAQREQARQAAEQQRAAQSQAAEQQRAVREQGRAAQEQARQQQAQAAAQARQQRPSQAAPAPPNNGQADKDRHGRGQN